MLDTIFVSQFNLDVSHLIMAILKYQEIIAGLIVDSVIVIHVEAIAVSVMLMETVSVR